ncbi:2-succinyl-5-enolpyruvyl-6-hydroxy-3-cyclohexene-1-carboxylic-acid synthase [Azospirillum cavernae]|uniref:2-succinyl-5-enolpyruvyl-6-hydroxy-3-cyclohexene-1-carboxylate synthase n=1 Tax=Azospirillum cavernae TaxID=2320860 RepID=A0A418VQ50_9PROT|nr:2-succinyl-5-enolpyruvyl-6-hydroxy-3-cyclohexene-1-carboxylic-acid synthase [Azospirillum cavernae]RJF78387.1 2-succinyl-5-enolpyruvyl-6-hydroxy-3-cyclohexene-1-carboxylic-acid synthase [Azospirillum cavernae]
MSATGSLDSVIEQPAAAPTAASTPDSRPAEKDNTTFRGIVQGDAELNFEWSAFLIDSLVAAGVTHVVMCPGAQMAPLALACRANPALKITVVIDERAAGFFALGLSRVTRRPTILICTSGSAVGEFFPAVMESSTGMIPLILITADRAPENQDRCSAQAIDQIRAYGAHARSSHSLPLPDASIDTLSALASRIYEQSLWPMPGPVHVNQPFRDPLVPKNRVKRAVPKPPTITEPVIQLRQEDIDRMAETLSGRRGVIVCGATENAEEPGFPAAVYELARQLAAPIIADPFSNLRFGAPAESGVIARADTFLRAARFTATHQPEWILNFGGPAMSKPVLTYMQESTASDYIVVDPTTRWSDPLLRATHIVRSSPETLCRALTESGSLKPAPDVWRQSFIACDGFIDTLSRSAFDTSLWEAPIVRRLIKAAPDGAVVFSGNSMSVRDFDSFSGNTDTRLRLLANRGTNGIDGSIGTLIGIAAAQRHTKTVCMIGDMAFSHDVGSLQLAGDLDIVLVVLNNGGGGIFEYLPTANVPEYQDFLSPPTLSIGAAGKACGWQHWEIHDLDGLNAALDAAMAAKGPCLIEAVIDRKASVRQHKLFWSAVNGINATIRLRGPEGMIATFGQVQPASQDAADDSLNFDRDD